jgi:nicotinamide mononucleotide transporter
MHDVLRNIWAGLSDASPLDQANLILGIAGVGLMIRRSLWAFPIGLIAVAVQGVLFYRARFYADAALQVFFFWTLAWGWWHWVRDKGAAPELPVSSLSTGQRWLVLGLAGLGTIGWAVVLRSWTDAVMPFRDAFIASFSVAAQILQARKNLENWWLWLAVNSVAIVSYFRADLAFTAFLYAIYLVLAVLGWRAWRRVAANSVLSHG